MFTPNGSPCNLCPRMCGARRDEGRRGICGAGGGMLLARAALHYWEEPPLSGERGSGALFFVNCPLGCVYCQNRAIAKGGHGYEVPREKLATICLDLQAQGALNVNCVTPTHYAKQIAEAIDEARSQGLDLPIVWNTSGYERPEMVRWLKPTVDIWLTDFKYASPELAARYSNAPDYPKTALESLKAMVDATGPEKYDLVDNAPRMLRGVIVRHLMLPNALKDSKQVLSLLYREFGNEIKYSIMNQYTPVIKGQDKERFPELSQKSSTEDYDRLLDFADELGIDDYFWQEGPAAEETFIPTWNGEGVV